MVTNEQELNKKNKKLAEFAEFNTKHDFQPVGCDNMKECVRCGCIYPPVSKAFKDCSTPNFIQSLENCFKYLVPKIMEDGYGYILSDSCGKKPHIFTLYCGYNEGEEKSIFSASAETPALALCLAISKLLEEK